MDVKTRPNYRICISSLCAYPTCAYTRRRRRSYTPYPYVKTPLRTWPRLSKVKLRTMDICGQARWSEWLRRYVYTDEEFLKVRREYSKVWCSSKYKWSTVLYFHTYLWELVSDQSTVRRVNYHPDGHGYNHKYTLRECTQVTYYLPDVYWILIMIAVLGSIVIDSLT